MILLTNMCASGRGNLYLLARTGRGVRLFLMGRKCWRPISRSIPVSHSFRHPIKQTNKGKQMHRMNLILAPADFLLFFFAAGLPLTFFILFGAGLSFWFRIHFMSRLGGARLFAILRILCCCFFLWQCMRACVCSMLFAIIFSLSIFRPAGNLHTPKEKKK